MEAQRMSRIARSGLRVVDVSNPNAPTLADTFDTSGDPFTAVTLSN